MRNRRSGSVREARHEAAAPHATVIEEVLQNEDLRKSISSFLSPETLILSTNICKTFRDEVHARLTQFLSQDGTLRPLFEDPFALTERELFVSRNQSSLQIPQLEETPWQELTVATQLDETPWRVKNVLAVRQLSQLKQAAEHIKEMCKLLLLPPKHVSQVWEIFKVAVLNMQLLLGRHLDQLISCAIYGVCKVNGIQVTFRDILLKYRQQHPQAFSSIFRQVRMKSADDPPMDIICFYNLIFIPAMKERIMLAKR